MKLANTGSGVTRPDEHKAPIWTPEVARMAVPSIEPELGVVVSHPEGEEITVVGNGLHADNEPFAAGDSAVPVPGSALSTWRSTAGLALVIPRPARSPANDRVDAASGVHGLQNRPLPRVQTFGSSGP
jgi:hypothetical protein